MRGHEVVADGSRMLNWSWRRDGGEGGGERLHWMWVGIIERAGSVAGCSPRLVGLNACPETVLVRDVLDVAIDAIGIVETVGSFLNIVRITLFVSDLLVAVFVDCLVPEGVRLRCLF